MKDLLDSLTSVREYLVRGAVAVDGNRFDLPEEVLATVLRDLFAADDSLRQAAAVQRHLAGEVSSADACRLAGLFDTELEGIVEQYSEVCLPGGNRTELIKAVETVDEDAAALAIGVSRLREIAEMDGYGGPDDVIDAAVGRYFHKHPSLRHAATAAWYESTSISTGMAAEMAGVQPGPEICSLLKDHGVTPRVGPAAGEEFASLFE